MHSKHPIEKITTWVGSVPSLVIHTAIFIVFFVLSFEEFLSWDLMFLILTTLVSLEAIYLAIFIQMTVNRQAASLKEVEEDIEEIQEDVEEMQEDVDEIQEDLEEISADEAEERRKQGQAQTLTALTADVKRMLEHLEQLKRD